MIDTVWDVYVYEQMQQPFPIRNKRFQKCSQKFEIKSVHAHYRKKENVAEGGERQNIYKIQKSETALFVCPPST